MTGIPHAFFVRESSHVMKAVLPSPGHYAVGNLFFNPKDEAGTIETQATFTNIADGLGLRVLGWREVPCDGSILGPASGSKVSSLSL